MTSLRPTVGGEHDTASATQTIVTGLQPHTKYDIILQAFNNIGTGPASNLVVGLTKEDSESITIIYRASKFSYRNGFPYSKFLDKKVSD